ILDEMVENSQCFVCKSKLDEHNKTFIKEILIPHFKGETTQKDTELNNLETLKDSLKNQSTTIMQQWEKPKGYRLQSLFEWRS
mgnify:CR=1